MDSKMVKSGSLIIFLFLVVGLPLSWAGPQVVYHMAYFERQGSQSRSLEARVQGEEIFIDKQRGLFTKEFKSWPLVLQSLSPLEELVILNIDNFPALTLQRKFKLLREENILGKSLAHYQIFLEVKAKEEPIPLTEEESKMNLLLRPFGVEAVHLKGEGDCWIDLQSQTIVTEQFVLKGEVVRHQIEEGWQIEYAEGLEHL